MAVAAFGRPLLSVIPGLMTIFTAGMKNILGFLEFFVGMITVMA